MENERREVYEKLALLEPEWRADPAWARERVALQSAHGADRGGPKRWGRIGALAAALCVAASLTMIPEARTVAQGLWERLTLSRVDVVRLDLSRLPLRSQVTMSLIEEKVASVDEAGRKAGFRPDLPPIDLLDVEPELTVDGPMTVAQTIDVPALQSALDNAGATDITVPADWQGVTLRAGIQSMVTAKYPGSEVEIVQTAPVELKIPAGFPLERFAETAFRSMGVGWREARRLAREFVAHPAWLIDSPPSQAANVTEVMLRSGPAILVENLDGRGAVELACVVWSTPERTYAVSSPNRELTMRVAGALR